jgi:hypothetical protein
MPQNYDSVIVSAKSATPQKTSQSPHTTFLTHPEQAGFTRAINPYNRPEDSKQRRNNVPPLMITGIW